MKGTEKKNQVYTSNRLMDSGSGKKKRLHGSSWTKVWRGQVGEKSKVIVLLDGHRERQLSQVEAKPTSA